MDSMRREVQKLLDTAVGFLFDLRAGDYSDGIWREIDEFLDEVEVHNKSKPRYYTHRIGKWKCENCGWEGEVVVSSDSKTPPDDAGECKWECGPLVKVDDGLAS